MEFNEKLQALRKGRGLTQEELAQALYVSRTAISKWESGRGYPSIDSLKAISCFFSVTVDELLSGEALQTDAEESDCRNAKRLCSKIMGWLDISHVVFFFLPLFAQNAEGGVQAVSLPALTQVQPYLRAAYFAAVIVMLILGAWTLVFSQRIKWVQNPDRVSIGLGAMGLVLFVVSRQPYAALFAFVILVIKVLLLKKHA